MRQMTPPPFPGSPHRLAGGVRWAEPGWLLDAAVCSLCALPRSVLHFIQPASRGLPVVLPVAVSNARVSKPRGSGVAMVSDADSGKAAIDIQI